MPEKIIACSSCGSARLEQITARTYACSSCGHSGEPLTFIRRQDYDEFKLQKDIAHMHELKLWGQKVIGHSIPVVVLINWATAMYYAIFFILGFIGYFQHAWFAWMFLYLSIAFVALGFGILVKWGKERITI